MILKLFAAEDSRYYTCIFHSRTFPLLSVNRLKATLMHYGRRLECTYVPRNISLFSKAVNDALKVSTVVLPSSTQAVMFVLRLPSPSAIPSYSWTHSGAVV